MLWSRLRPTSLSPPLVNVREGKCVAATGNIIVFIVAPIMHGDVSGRGTHLREPGAIRRQRVIAQVQLDDCAAQRAGQCGQSANRAQDCKFDKGMTPKRGAALHAFNSHRWFVVPLSFA